MRYIIVVCLSLYADLLYADYKDDIGHTRLANELGASLPTGAGINVSQSEADTDGVYGAPFAALPDASDSRFSGKTINNITANNDSISGHATSVGSYFYGNTGMASGITQIDAYEANGWMVADYLYYSSGWQPLISSSRIANHSWVGNVTDPAVASELLRRLDWVIETDEFLQFVGVRNSIGTNYNLFSAAYNAIAVGCSDGIHSTGSPSVDSTYVAGRTRTEIVAPRSTSSSATPVVAATAALLVETAHSTPGLSNGSTSNRNGDTIYNAERSETVRAALLAGADRYTRNQSPNSDDGVIADIIDYRSTGNQSVNGLDSRYGAGQVNAYNSYQIIAAGEQNSLEDDGASAGSISQYGFDYDPSFGGNNNGIATYYFSTTTPAMFHASLVWNLDIDGGRLRSFNESAVLHDLDLYLYDVTGTQVELIRSESTIDNSENIWLPLSANRNYMLRVTRKGSFDWDYALAWRLTTDTDGDTFVDEQDNCPVNTNADQLDSDGDGIGDACDTDIDDDGITNTVDNCPSIANADQSDIDNDTIGDVCDADADGDGLLNTVEDVNANGIVDTGETDPLNADTDSDGYSDGDEVAQGTDPLDPSSFPVVANGDINDDGEVNILDMLLAQQILAGIISATPEQLARADVAPLIASSPSPDGQFNVGDLVVIQRKALGLITF